MVTVISALPSTCPSRPYYHHHHRRFHDVPRGYFSAATIRTTRSMNRPVRVWLRNSKRRIVSGRGRSSRVEFTSPHPAYRKISAAIVTTYAGFVLNDFENILLSEYGDKRLNYAKFFTKILRKLTFSFGTN